MWRYFVFLSTFISPILAQAPSTDLFLVELGGKSPQVQNITKRAEYDNQPYFLAGGKAFLYTSQRSGQTDIYKYELDRGRSLRLTQTAESEYSATPLPGEERFSVIRVEADGRQRLWSFRMDGTDPQLLFPDLEPVGYQVWPSADLVVTFILGQPATLQSAHRSTGSIQILARKIGRCLRQVPGENAISYVSKAEEPWMIRKWNARTGVIENVAPVLTGSEDYAWSGAGDLFMGRDGGLFRYSWEERRWKLLNDLSSEGVDRITRLDVTPDGQTFVLVAESRK